MDSSKGVFNRPKAQWRNSTHFTVYTQLIVFFLTALLLSGCGDQNAFDDEFQRRLAHHDRAKNADQNDEQASVIAASTSARQGSPASISNSNHLIPDSSPEDVCRVFLKSLQAGDQISAQQLLTRQAIIETSRANLELAAPGNEQSQFEVLPARYNSQTKETAQVECLIRQFAADGQFEQFKLTWNLRRLQFGWKIWGMTAENEVDGTIDVLSFESPTDIARIKGSLSPDEFDGLRNDRHARLQNAADRKLK